MQPRRKTPTRRPNPQNDVRKAKADEARLERAAAAIERIEPREEKQRSEKVIILFHTSSW